MTVCQKLVDNSKSHQLKVRGPVRLPTRELRITTRKTPCGEGSKVSPETLDSVIVFDL